MQLWKNNRTDQAWELPNSEIIDRFEASPWSKIDGWSTDRSLRMFLTTSEDGGLSSVFEEREYMVLIDQVFERMDAR